MKRKYVKADEFAYKYDVTVNNIYVKKSNGEFDEDAFSVVRGTLYIDENYFTRRREFKLKLKNLAHENYYALKYDLIDDDYVEKRSDTAICKLIKEKTTYSDRSLQSWRQFISLGLFSLNSSGILDTTSAPMVAEFYRVSQKIVRDERLQKEGVKQVSEVSKDVEPVVTDFRTTEEYFDYFEAKRFLEDLREVA